VRNDQDVACYLNKDKLKVQLLVKELIPLLEVYFGIDKGDLVVRSNKTKTARDVFIFAGKRHLNKSLT